MLMHVFRSGSLALFLLAASVLSSPVRIRSPYLVKDKHHVPNRWSNIGPAPADKLINLHIGLRQSQFDELERHLYEGTSMCHRVKPLQDMADLSASINSLSFALWTTSHGRGSERAGEAHG